MEAVFLKILDMSLVSAYCIAIVLLIRLFLRKAPKSFSYILWIAVFIRLALPFTPESPVSLVPQAVSDHGVTAWVSEKANPVFDPSFTAEAGEINPIREANGDVSPIDSANQQIKTFPATQNLPQAQITAHDRVTSSEGATETGNSGTMNPSMTQIFSIVWLVGLISLLSYNFIAYIILKKRLRSSVWLEANIFESPSIPSPFLFGIFRPGIFIPSGLEDSERAHILRHEQIHIQRGDYVVKAILFAITCIHWFNPLVWLAFAFMSRDMEMSCDEKVIRELGYGIKKIYSSSLLSLATGRSLLHATPLAFGEGNLKGRIKNVLGYRKPALWIILASSVLVGIVVFGLIFNPLQNVKAANQTTETTAPQIETTADASQTTPTTSAEPTVTNPVWDDPNDPYDNLFIDVDGERISYRDVLNMQSSQNFDGLNPLEYITTSPVDVSNFQTVFSEAGYVVEESTGIHNEKIIYGWEAKSSDGKDVVRCHNFDSEEDANQAVVQMIMEYYYADSLNPYPYDSFVLRFMSTDSALLFFDTDGYYEKNNTFYITYQTGSSVIHAEIVMEVPRLQTFITATEKLGLNFPGAYNPNQNPSEWPENAAFDFSSDFVNVLTERGYEVEMYDSNFDWEWYEAENTEMGVRFCNGLKGEDFSPGKDFLMRMNIPEDDYWFINSTYEYHCSDSYEMIINNSENSYCITVYFDATGLETPYNGPFNRTIWYAMVWGDLTNLSDTEAAAVRAEVDAVIREMYFPG